MYDFAAMLNQRQRAGKFAAVDIPRLQESIEILETDRGEFEIGHERRRVTR
jgi:hypothetical protein